MRLKALIGTAVVLLFALLLLLVRRSPTTPAASKVPVAAGAPLDAPHRSPTRVDRNASSLPPSLDRLWAHPVSEPVFADFAAWSYRFLAESDSDRRRQLEAEGEQLAKARLTAMADLISKDPKRAMELAVPFSVRSQLPASIRDLLERPINTRGDFEVVGIVPLPGHQSETPSIVRSAILGGERYQAFTFDEADGYVTRSGVPLNGIAVPVSFATVAPKNPLYQPTQLMAVGPPWRVLEPQEREIFKQTIQREAICEVTKQSTSVPSNPANSVPQSSDGSSASKATAGANSDETFIEYGGKIMTFCGKVHASDWAASTLAGEGTGLPGGTTIPIAESSYTEGRKRMLLMRPIFTDYTTIMTTNQALSHYTAFSNFMYELSYGKLVLAGLRAGSDITPEMLLPGVVADYDNTGLGKLYNTCKDVASTNYGYDLSKYDFTYVCTAGRPSATYAGLAFVGGVGFHLANSYWGEGTASHEFGHNLGFNHANFWQTDAKSIIGNGTSIEYGDGDDPMGGAGTSPNAYGSRYKNYVNWIHDSDIATITNSGLYRLYAFDNPVGVGLRGLRFPRDASVNYWLQYRTRKGGKARTNGAQLLWTGNDNRSSLFLDVMLKNASGDNALTIGRTFSDTNFDLHITPIGKGNTFPESLDVVVNRGPFPANRPPTVVASASSLTPALGEVVTFSASASDPNGDALAYTWDFGDADYSVDNSATTTHSFGSAGEYAVQCTVSDMKGGTARQSVIVRVGAASGFRISGHVFNPKNQPVAGIKVSIDSTHYAFTDSDGSYTLTRLAAGSYTVDALETVSGAATLVHPFFSNPVTVGPDFTTADFIAVPGTLNIYTPLSARNAVWKYFDKGTDLGTAWIAPAYSDNTWSNGPAILGYGEGNESTVISYGPDPNNKYITYYFRRQFTVPDPTIYTNLLLEAMRDDGIIVYLNGSEVYRDNMPAGPVNYQTFASTVVEPAGYQQSTISRTGLVPGVNVLAAEVHQADITSSDITFDCALSGLSLSNATGFSVAYISSPANYQAFTSPTDIVVSAVAQSGASAVSTMTFYGDGSSLGTASSLPYNVTWSSPASGQHLLTAVASLANGTQLTSPPVTITISAPSSLPLISTGAVWKYFAADGGPTSDWATPAFDDSTWPAGPAQLGFGEGDEQTVLPDPNAPTTHITAVYFRQALLVTDPGAITNLTAQLLRDDGAIVYFNGVEVLRDNMAPGPVSFGTLASNAIDDGKVFYSYRLDPATLVPGTNIIAVELHNSSPGSGDLSFDFSLGGTLTTNRARGIWLVAPTNGTALELPGNMDLAAQVVAGGTLGVSLVEFYADGVKIAERSAAPYRITWTNPPAGTHSLTAVATDSDGATINSSPVQVAVTAPRPGRALISFGDVWKYLDDGSDQGTAWRGRFFDDRSWMAGPARLGYGGDGEITTVSYGTNASSKYITTWFRKSFVAPTPLNFNALLLRLVRDDGAVVYLNGTEVYRNNIQPGLVSWNSLAPLTIDAPGETTPIDVVVNASLLPGTNSVAVEVHQAAITSSDLGFDLALIGLNNTNTTQGVYLTAPAQGAHYNRPATVSLAAYATAPTPVSLVEYFDGASKVAQASTAPFAATWSGPAVGSHTITARATYGAGLLMTSPPVSIVVGVAPPPIAPVFNTLIAADSDWRYWDSATAVGNGWQQQNFNDSAWPSARARFGWGLDGEQTALNPTRLTQYFRKWFVPTNDAVLTELFFELIRDDGAVVYLNGTEVFRSNMPLGPITPSTLASSTVNTPDETTWFETVLATSASGLTGGSNLIAVELHQASAGSSDASFNFALYGSGNTDRRVYLGQPVSRSPYFNSAPVPLEAFAWAGPGLTVTNVDFFADGVKIGSAVSAPYKSSWSVSDFGSHQVFARMTDSAGNTLDSSTVTIQLSRELVTTTLIQSNAVWKYLDNGSNQGTNWSQLSFNDSSWASGPARLGYGGDGEATTVSYGLNANAKYITTYFRRSIIVPPGVGYTNLNINLVRDDGAVVYLNGKELFRDNMPGGAVNFGTLAVAAVSGTDEQTFFPFTIATTNILTGTNVVAVEIHQSGGTSSDIGFNMELIASGYVVDSTPPPLSVVLTDGQVELSWPDSFVSWSIYETNDITTPFSGWSATTGNVLFVSGRHVLSLPPTGSNRFFRLARP